MDSFIRARAGALLTATLLACGLAATSAEAAVVGESPAAPPAQIIALPSTREYRVVATSPTTADIIGQGAGAGLIGHVQTVGGGIGDIPVAEFPDIWGWIKNHVSIPTGGGFKPGSCKKVTQTKVIVEHGKVTGEQTTTTTECSAS